MSMTLVAAKAYVSKILGLHNDSTALSMAADAIQATVRKWNALADWTFLLKDTATGFTVTGCTIASTVISPATAGDLDGVNRNVTVTMGTGDSATLAASTTVSSYTRDASGHVATVTLSNAPGGTTSGSHSFVFSGDIPLVATVQEYNLPNDFTRPYGARLLTNKWQLTYIKYREWNRKIWDQSVNGIVEAYTTYNPLSWATQGHTRLRVFRIPNATDTLHLQYYRSIDATATSIDILDDFLYAFLDDARVEFLLQKNGDDSRLPQLMEANAKAITRCLNYDQDQGEDEDVRIITQMETSNQRRPLWTNGPFDSDWY